MKVYKLYSIKLLGLSENMGVPAAGANQPSQLWLTPDWALVSRKGKAGQSDQQGSEKSFRFTSQFLLAQY